MERMVEPCQKQMQRLTPADASQSSHHTAKMCV